jgi:hypothetical protein
VCQKWALRLWCTLRLEGRSVRLPKRCARIVSADATNGTLERSTVRAHGPLDNGRLSHGEMDTGSGIIMLATLPSTKVHDTTATTANRRVDGCRSRGSSTACSCTSTTSTPITTRLGAPDRRSCRNPKVGHRRADTAPKTPRATARCSYTDDAYRRTGAVSATGAMVIMFSTCRGREAGCVRRA